MPRLIITTHYKKRAEKFIKKHPDLTQRYLKTLQILELNPTHPSLRLHKLKGSLHDIYSVSINMSYRITLEFLIQDDIIILVNIGSHDEVY